MSRKISAGTPWIPLKLKCYKKCNFKLNYILKFILDLRILITEQPQCLSSDQEMSLKLIRIQKVEKLEIIIH